MKNFIWGKPIKPTKKVNTMFSFNYVSKFFVEKQLKSLRREKAAGYDQIPPGFLKYTASVISGPLSFVINLSLSKGSVPCIWKNFKVITLGGSHDGMPNYRPISILPVVLTLERAVDDQSLTYLKQNKILWKNQFGYRKKRSTELSTLYLEGEISKQIDNGNMVRALYINL